MKKIRNHTIAQCLSSVCQQSIKLLITRTSVTSLSGASVSELERLAVHVFVHACSGQSVTQSTRATAPRCNYHLIKYVNFAVIISVSTHR